MPIKLVVVNENILGFIFPDSNNVSILHASILKGCLTHSDNDGFFMLNKNDVVRLATKKDFEDFRVQFANVYDTEEYEYCA